MDGTWFRLVRGRVLMTLVVALAASVTPLWLPGNDTKAVSAEPVGQAPTAPAPTVPGPGTAYFGAFVDPSGAALTPGDPTGGTASLRSELNSLPAFNDQTGGPPSILSTFQDWSEQVDTAGLESVAATGAIPMVTWDCGDTDAHVVAGLDDGAVTTEARALAAADVPILFRWFPDPNLGSGTGMASCLGNAGAAGYVAAYRHIHSLFAAAGATNVAFVWSVDTSPGADANLSSYYPGVDAVDWFAADANMSSAGGVQATGLSTAFASWYSAFSGAGRPMMLSSTGADVGSQSAYLGPMLADLPTQYPSIKAVVYFDAPDMASGDPYQLDPAGSSSLRDGRASAYLNPPRTPTTTVVDAPQHVVQAGTTVTLRAAVDTHDNSGSISFVANGAVIDGCVFIPIRTPPSCQTSHLGVGTQSIVAIYSGDASSAPSSATPVAVTVGAPRTPGAPPRVASEGAPGGGTMASSHLTTKAGSLSQSQSPSQPLVPPAGSAYLGSFVDPSGASLRLNNPTGGIAGFPSELGALPAVESGLGRPLSIVELYLNWKDHLTVTQLDQVAATGGMPMITWNCGDTDARVAAGRDDAQIGQIAAELTRFKLPVLLRWFPDPNVGTTAGKACLGNGGPAGYIAAYRHIHDSLAAAGATNVAFVWSVDTTAPQADTKWKSYYPGAQYADWIGADGYSVSNSTASVAQDFGTWYTDFSADKPLMISQTAALPSLQAQYIQQLSTVPVQYPQIRAVVYFDAPDVTTGRSYELQPQSAGQQHLDALERVTGLPTREGVDDYRGHRIGQSRLSRSGRSSFGPGR